MHIPDGFLDLKTCVTTYLAAGASLKFSLEQLKKKFSEEQIPLLGLLGAFIFAAQMINLPIAGGTSGHLLGGVLAMLVVGPWAASIVMSAILIIQAVIFMDGGIAVLGANIFNIAIVQVVGSYLIYQLLDKVINSFKVNVFITACLATIISSVFAALELAFSGTVSLRIVIPAIVGWHLLIGLLEGLITVLVVVYLKRVIPKRLDFIDYKAGDSYVN
ncbi:ABC-type Co2+ transport system, permease component [Halobacteroides halobius DSM 5150]|uniref:ABC-type Co2+ transport system, permease component n=1 Tax=Halobacteroides halobius (strain ATCC 35273 / DSM 5150 / MD-1) TaxID=748449 RepID=L0K8T0_HALHC|nr:energy-coupling factor ABC transporter permease [Halobacteroides halobius]AGB41692.1 ABC-type Co2+ transport system, permease component [Halobacteroides halobius DSM 5150]